METNAPSQILTLDEAAAYLNVHPSTIYRLLKRREIPGFKIGSDWRFTRVRLDRWIAELHDEPAPEAVRGLRSPTRRSA
jgi:excisionase family DNA binding protein